MLPSSSAAFAHVEGARKKECVESKHRRLATKIAIMKALKKRGIMLVDVSPVPIYAGGNVEKRINKKTGSSYRTTLKQTSCIQKFTSRSFKQHGIRMQNT